MYKLLLGILIFAILVSLVVCKGINMKCPYCYKNGSHFHVQNFAIKTNHGPKKGNQFSHKMCDICMKNPGKSHFHLCF